MEHYRKHLQCLMAGSKIQVKIYIHFNIQFTFTSFKEYNPKIKSMTNNQTNKNTTNGCFCDCLFPFFICIYDILYFQDTYLHFTPFVQLQTVQTIYTFVANNGVYDEISNNVSFKDDFYLPCETRDDHLQSSVPIWLNSTQVNVSDVGQFNAFGLVKFAQHGTY